MSASIAAQLRHLFARVDLWSPRPEPRMEEFKREDWEGFGGAEEWLDGMGRTHDPMTGLIRVSNASLIADCGDPDLPPEPDDTPYCTMIVDAGGLTIHVRDEEIILPCPPALALLIAEALPDVVDATDLRKMGFDYLM